jgi:hypothetical protein
VVEHRPIDRVAGQDVPEFVADREPQPLPVEQVDQPAADDEEGVVPAENCRSPALTADARKYSRWLRSRNSPASQLSIWSNPRMIFSDGSAARSAGGRRDVR